MDVMTERVCSSLAVVEGGMLPEIASNAAYLQKGGVLDVAQLKFGWI